MRSRILLHVYRAKVHTSTPFLRDPRVDPESLHTCFMCPWRTVNGCFFFYFFFPPECGIPEDPISKKNTKKRTSGEKQCLICPWRTVDERFPFLFSFFPTEMWDPLRPHIQKNPKKIRISGEQKKHSLTVRQGHIKHVWAQRFRSLSQKRRGH